MPSKTAKHHKFMAAIAHSKEFAKKAGVPMSVGKDFINADKGKKFRKGGSTNPMEAKIANPRVHHGAIQLPNVSLEKYIGKKEGGIMHSEKGEMKEDITQDKKLIKKAFGMHDKQLHESKKTNLTKLKGGGMAMKETMGPRTMAKDVEAGSNKLLKFGESAVQKRGHTKGMEERDYKVEKTQGGAKGGKGTFGAAPIKMAKGGMCGGGKTMKKMSTGGSASSRADGIASKGKTRGTMC